MKTALIVGVSGIVGSNLADLLVSEGDWKVYGLARRPGTRAGVTPIAVDLQNADAVKEALKDVKPTHVFLCTWLRQSSEAENIAVNSAMVRNVLDATSGAGTVEHVALVTGLKHYMGAFGAFGDGQHWATPFREEMGRAPGENFYFAQEDEVFAAAERDGFGWTIHRPTTIIGHAVGNAMNMGVTLAVYASICKALNKPMEFPGNPQQWNGFSDITDARLLAKHLLWAATTSAARNQELNILNGDVFRWKWMWPRVAAWFGVEVAPFSDRARSMEEQFADLGPIWKKIAEENNLREMDINGLASPWHTDLDLTRPAEVIADMSKTRKLGFTGFQASDDSFFDLFKQLREERLIP